jgi:hypothetical protein
MGPPIGLVGIGNNPRLLSGLSGNREAVGIPGGEHHAMSTASETVPPPGNVR